MVVVCEAFALCNYSMLLVLSMKSYRRRHRFWHATEDCIAPYVDISVSVAYNTVSLSVFSVYLLWTSFRLYLPFDCVI